MRRMLRSPRTPRSLLIFCVCLLMVGIAWPQLAQTALFDRTVDDRLDQFTLGRFQRTALGSLQVTSGDLRDEPGAVQLAPLGLLQDWFNSPFNLPEKLSNMGATSIGNRIYVIGGTTNTEPPRRANVWSTAIDTTTGAPIDPGWEAEPQLPAVQTSNRTGFDAPIAEVTQPAVTSVTNADGSGYIYVLGGNAQVGTFDFSSYAVRIGTVGTDGRITSWQEGPAIPDPTGTISVLQRGLQDAAAVNLTIGDSTYVYIVGGLQRYLQGTGGQISTAEEGSKKVFYARVGANGQLVKPSNGEPGWDVAQNEIPVPGTGLWGATAVANRFVASGNAAAMYLMGGSGNLSGSLFASSVVYRAQFDGNGQPTWDWDGTLPSGLTGHAGVEFRGNIYVTGGQQGSVNEPNEEVLTSYVEDNLELPVFGDVGGANFLPNPALPRPRTRHGSVVISTDEGTAFVYVIGGRGDTTDGDTSDDEGTESVIYGKVGGIANVSDTPYAPNAWFYSNPYEITFDQAQVQKITWSTLITRTDSPMDIEMDYRTSNAESCDAPGWTDSDWQQLDGSGDANRSQNGRNEVPVETGAARCFQYRARLSTQGDFRSTPSLLNVSIQISIPGSPDLKPVDLAAVRDGSNNQTLTGLDVFVLNQNEVEQTLAADVEGPGDFFVDICIFPGESVPPPTMPIPESGGCTNVYALVNKSVMGVDVKYKVRGWLDATNDQPITSEGFNALFPQVGMYTLYVAADSTDYVNEGTLGGEDNNLASLGLEVFADPTDPTKPDVDFRVESPGLLLPIIGN